jgi:chaperonin cofactor prefoldin
VAEPQDMILPLLQEMRRSMEERFDKIDRKLEAHDTRFERLEKRFDNLREAVNGESVLGRYAAAEVEERLEAIEKRLAALEKHS